ncbi:MAG: transposase [Bryobacteraceae bacterium]|nr:transposase [Bryobacteraceae bacterium]
MPRNQRCVLPGQAYHITQRGTNRQRVFFTSSDRSAYLRLLGQNLDDAEVRLLAWCLMPNHIHLVAVPERADSLAVLLRRVHGRYAQMVNARRLRSGHLWQNRFYSCALSPSHLWRALAYVERNPVRAGIAGRAEDYRWSSAAAHLGLAKDRYALLDMEFWREQGGAAGWSELLAQPEQALEMRLPRRCTYAGRPLGDQEYVAMFEERFGRVWRRWGF